MASAVDAELEAVRHRAGRSPKCGISMIDLLHAENKNRLDDLEKWARSSAQARRTRVHGNCVQAQG
jgi:hypothetical protein